ncbi:MAG: nuclear transport factor 2 family protein [Fimbriimonadales bacterium]|nr:nuclear transport factor 2 family protein [Fimbriimonadales bacterium]
MRRTSGRVLGILVALVLIAGAGVVAWYFLVYTKSPGYALNQFFAAAKANDTERVNRYTDRSGPLMILFQQLSDPVQAIYPGYGRQDMGKVEKVDIGTITVEGETAKAPVTMEVSTPQGQRITLRPTYVLRKTEEGWKVSVEATFAGSFNEFVPPAAQRAAIQQLRALLANPGVAQMARMQLQGLRAEIEKYPQLRDFLRRAGLY